MLTKCDICTERDWDKGSMPCSKCSDNKLYVSHFKAHPVIKTLTEEGVVTKEGLKEAIDGNNNTAK